MKAGGVSAQAGNTIDPVTGPPLENLVNTALKYARGGNSNKLAKLMKEHGEQILPLMSKANRKWVKEKMSSHAKNKARRMAERVAKGKEADDPTQETTETSAGTATAPPRPKGKRARKRARENGGTDPVQSKPAPASTSAATKETFTEEEINNPLGDKVSPEPVNAPFGTTGKTAFARGRTVEEAEADIREQNRRATETTVIEKPAGVVAADALYFDDLDVAALEKKLAESTVIKANAEKKGKTDLAARTGAIIDEVNKVLEKRKAGEKPVPLPVKGEQIDASKYTDEALGLKPVDEPVDPVAKGAQILAETEAELAEIDPEFTKGTSGPKKAGKAKSSKKTGPSGPPVTMESAKAVSAQIAEATAANDLKKAAKLQKQLNKILAELEKN